MGHATGMTHWTSYPVHTYEGLNQVNLVDSLRKSDMSFSGVFLLGNALALQQ
jgi:hypothetical protein